MEQSNNSANHLQEALAILIQNQAAFLGRVSEMDRINSERFARIEDLFVKVDDARQALSRRTVSHMRILEALPEVIRQKIGFQPPAQAGSE